MTGCDAGEDKHQLFLREATVGPFWTSSALQHLEPSIAGVWLRIARISADESTGQNTHHNEPSSQALNGRSDRGGQSPREAERGSGYANRKGGGARFPRRHQPEQSIGRDALTAWPVDPDRASRPLRSDRSARRPRRSRFDDRWQANVPCASDRGRPGPQTTPPQFRLNGLRSANARMVGGTGSGVAAEVPILPVEPAGEPSRAPDPYRPERRARFRESGAAPMTWARRRRSIASVAGTPANAGPVDETSQIATRRWDCGSRAARKESAGSAGRGRRTAMKSAQNAGATAIGSGRRLQKNRQIHASIECGLHQLARLDCLRHRRRRTEAAGKSSQQGTPPHWRGSPRRRTESEASAARPVTPDIRTTATMAASFAKIA